MDLISGRRLMKFLVQFLPTGVAPRSVRRRLAISSMAGNLGGNPRESRSKICCIITVSSEGVSFRLLGTQSRYAGIPLYWSLRVKREISYVRAADQRLWNWPCLNAWRARSNLPSESVEVEWSGCDILGLKFEVAFKTGGWGFRLGGALAYGIRYWKSPCSMPPCCCAYHGS